MREYQVKTKKVYEKLGLDYLLKIEELPTPGEIVDFMQMLTPGSDILELGCAGGRDTQNFIDAGHRVIAIDIIKEFIKIAQEKHPGAKYLVKDVLNMDFRPGSFDGIWANAVLLHFKDEDITKILKKIRSILRPGGVLFSSYKIGEGEDFVKDKLSVDEFRYFNFVNEKEIKKLLERQGFENLIVNVDSDPAGRTDVKWIKIISRKL